MSYDEIRRKYEHEHEAAKARKTKSMQSRLERLKAESIHKITVEYDGHDDEGFVKRITFVTTDGKRVDNDVNLVNRDPESTLSAIEEFVFALLPGAWETNEGGFGTCVIDVATGDYDLKHIWGRGKPQDLG